MLRMEMLPAHHGDALWIEYGGHDDVHRVLIDGGPETTHTTIRDRIERLDDGDRHFELLVITHVDADHIAGMLRVLTDGINATFEDVWFNGWRHLPETVEKLGPVQGERLSAWLEDNAVSWNGRFGGRAVARDGGVPPTRELEGGLKLTVLGPGLAQLAALRPEWRTAVEDAGLAPKVPAMAQPPTPSRLEALGPPRPEEVEAWAARPFDGDDTKPNSTSITLLAEFDGRRLLLTGDAHANVLISGIRRLIGDQAKTLEVDVFKVPHHGSQKNLSRELAALVRAERYLFSSDGSHFGHPDEEAVARVALDHDGTAQLCFNYRTTFNSVWADPGLARHFKYEPAYPDTTSGGWSIEL